MQAFLRLSWLSARGGRHGLLRRTPWRILGSPSPSLVFGDVNTAMMAAGRLQAVLDSRAGQTDLADVICQVNRIIKAVKSTVPQHMWGEIAAKLEHSEQQLPVDVEAEAFDDADDGFDPFESAEDDELRPSPVGPAATQGGVDRCRC